jgi:hypothetical protein
MWSGEMDDYSLILVGILPEPRDLDIARLFGWYRIPLRRAPKVVDVDYLAFYQPASFGEENRWRIQYLAPVRGHELVTRAELFRQEPDHPRAHEEYYKVQLGSLELLPRPILADQWRRLTFLYTIGSYLQRAETLNDLVVHSEEREQLWKSLRERGMNSAGYSAGQTEEMELDALTLEMLGSLFD